MPVSHSHKLVFVHIPKNAGTAITKSSSIKFEKDGHHSWMEHQKHLGPEKWNEYFKFAVVRNPWDRVVSNYKYAKMLKSYWHSTDGSTQYSKHVDYDLCSNLTFEECVKLLKEDPRSLRHHGWRSQFPYVCDWDKKIALDKVFYYSELNGEEFKKIIPTLDKVNVSTETKQSYKDYYNEELIDLVSQIYQEDIKIFNFTYDYE